MTAELGPRLTAKQVAARLRIDHEQARERKVM